MSVGARISTSENRPNTIIPTNSTSANSACEAAAPALQRAWNTTPNTKV